MLPLPNLKTKSRGMDSRLNFRVDYEIQQIVRLMAIKLQELLFVCCSC
jgi:hypothetical protein